MLHMLDLAMLRAHPEEITRGLQGKGIVVDIPHLLALDAQKRVLQSRVEGVAAQKHAASADVAAATGADRIARIEQLRALDASSAHDREELQKITEELRQLLWSLPNLPAPDVRVGKDETENEIIRSWGEVPVFPFTPKASWELAPVVGAFDTDRAAKVSGSRFGYLTGPGVLLEFALIRYALRTLTAAGFTPIVPPVLVSATAMEAMGYTIHGGREETYYLERDDAYLVGTAEQAIGPMHRDEVLEEENLPKRYLAFSTCFRREAGSYGKDTKGIFRVHQFDKLEMFSFTTPEQSDGEHERFLHWEEELLQGLRLPYQVVKMCTGDLGIPAARKFDLEAWFPSERRYRELTSTSTCTDWQARRLHIRYRPTNGETPRFVHMLNGTAFAIGRTICALLEHGQQSDGSVVVPEILEKDVGTDVIPRVA